MKFASFILATTIVWTVVLFMALPFNVSVPKSQKKGHASSAPENPHMGAKIIISLIISMILSAIFVIFFE